MRFTHVICRLGLDQQTKDDWLSSQLKANNDDIAAFYTTSLTPNAMRCFFSFCLFLLILYIPTGDEGG